MMYLLCIQIEITCVDYPLKKGNIDIIYLILGQFRFIQKLNGDQSKNYNLDIHSTQLN